MIWFTSDQHFNHQNIIAYCKRPYRTLREMNEVIIDRHNSVVGKKDMVWHLGDFSWSEAASFLSKLNGKHNLCLGNHDHKHIKKWEFDLFDRVEQACIVKYEHKSLWLSHYAHARWPSSHMGSGHIFGHSHGLYKPDNKSFDVGVDTNAFFPYSWLDIFEVLAKLSQDKYTGEFFKDYNEPSEEL